MTLSLKIPDQKVVPLIDHFEMRSGRACFEKIRAPKAVSKPHAHLLFYIAITFVNILLQRRHKESNNICQW